MGKNSDSSSSTSYDPVYNAGLLEIQQANEERSSFLFDQFTSGGSVSEMEYLQRVVEANAGLLPDQTRLEKAGMKDALTAINERAPLRTKFIDSAMEGVDAEAAMDKAEANVSHAFKGAEGQIRRSMMRSGGDVNSGSFITAQRNSMIDKAKAEAGARTRAYDNAESESFGRLRDAMSFGV